MTTPDLTPESIELLPCPFCGCADVMLFCDEEEASNNSGPSRRAQCSACHIEAPFYETKGQAITAWNTRATPAPTENAALVEAAKEAIDLLAERKQGSAARSPSHNARLVLEAALSSRAAAPKGGDT